MEYHDNDCYIYWTNESGEWEKIVTTYGEYKKLPKEDVKEIEITDKRTWQSSTLQERKI